MRNTPFLSIVITLVLIIPSSAEILNVPGDYVTIQYAINLAVDGDTIIVEPGIYLENINFLGKDITVTSTDPENPDIVAATIIDGYRAGSVITFNSDEGPEAVLTGFTITGGFGTCNVDFGDENYIYWGAGIYCSNASPTIKNNVISGNTGPQKMEGDNPNAWQLCYGGGISCFESDAIIYRNIIKDNTAFAGAGILSYLGDPTINNNLIYNNSAYVGGGAILLASGNLINNTIVGNDASLTIIGETGIAGNVYAISDPEFGDGQYLIANNIICDAISGGGVVMAGSGGGLIVSNNVWNNSPENYLEENMQTGSIGQGRGTNRTGRSGNISENPLFVDPNNNDYHLQLDSPCIGTGNNSYIPEPNLTDIDDEPRIYAGSVDMGADEYVGYTEPIAYAGPNQYISTLDQVTLDGSGSIFSDSNGVKLFYWTQVGGPTVTLSDPNIAQPTFMPEVTGEYRFQLIVSDGVLTSEPDDVLIVVGNRPPVADAGANKVLQVPGIIILDGTGSYDLDLTDEIIYSWRQLDGPQVVLEDANTATASFYCEQEGLYVFELILNDGLVNSEPSIVEVTTVVVTMNQQELDVGFNISNYFHYPDVSGKRVVYCIGSACDFTWNIRCKNLETDDTSSFAAGGLDTQPKIDGDIVVWFGGIGFGSPWYHEPSNTSVIARNIATNTQRVLRRYSMSESYSHPAVSDNKVVWLEHLGLDTSPIGSNEANNWWNTPYNICGADIADMDNPVYFTIAENVGTRDPYPCHSYSSDFDDVIDICGNIVVYEANGDIYGADISNIDDIFIFTICSDPSRQFDPAISGNIVIWTDQRNDSGDIYGADIFDIDNIREFEVIKAAGSQQQPAIDNCMIVYVDGTSEGGQIKTCCLTKQYGTLEIEMSGSPFGTGPAIDNENIVWQTSSYGQLQGISLKFAYSSIDGPFKNLTTGKYYEYIQHAINDSLDGDVIEVDPGIYYENILIDNKNVKVRSTEPNNPHIVADTIITGGNQGATVTFYGVIDANCELAGLTITGGNKGIYCNYTSPVITNCRITDNLDAGIYLYHGSNPILSRCDISANGGSGIEMLPYIAGRQKYYNHPELNNCIIAANQQYGITGDFSIISNCTICDNLQAGIHNSTAIIINSIIYFNGDGTLDAQIPSESSTVTFSDIQSLEQNSGNLDADPLFADPLNGDYHLKSQTGRWDPINLNWIQDDISSPCIDAGDPNSDIGSETEPNGSVINMGAYGGTAQASKSAGI